MKIPPPPRSTKKRIETLMFDIIMKQAGFLPIKQIDLQSCYELAKKIIEFNTDNINIHQ